MEVINIDKMMNEYWNIHMLRKCVKYITKIDNKTFKNIRMKATLSSNIKLEKELLSNILLEYINNTTDKNILYNINEFYKYRDIHPTTNTMNKLELIN
jgi:hypothetical protein